MFHYRDGEHREVAAWHNEVHRPANHGGIPGIYYSQDWVAPADYVRSRPPSDLENCGGEYASLFLSEGTLAQLEDGARAASEVRERAGRGHPFQAVTWRCRFEIDAVHGRDDLAYVVDAVPMAPNTGLIVRAEEILDTRRDAEYAKWQAAVEIPRLISSELFAACFEGHRLEKDGRKTALQLWFVDREDPLVAFEQALQMSTRGERLPDADRLRRPILSHVYRSLAGRYDYYD